MVTITADSATVYSTSEYHARDNNRGHNHKAFILQTKLS